MGKYLMRGGKFVLSSGGFVTVEPVITEYKITPQLTHITAAAGNPTTIHVGTIVVLSFSPESGDYLLPASVQVANAQYLWSKSTGQLTISNPVGVVYITIVAEERPKLAAPGLAIDGDNLKIADNDGRAESFDVYVDGTYTQKVPKRGKEA